MVITNGDREDAFLSLIRRAGLPTPKGNEEVDGARPDFSWTEYKIAVEIDDPSHASPRAFQEDRESTNDLQLKGWIVLRFTDWDLKHAPDECIAKLRAAFEMRSHLQKPSMSWVS
jgi:very-short-patch-repair endonuclease